VAKEDSFEYESLQDPQSIKDLIKGLLEGFDKGRIVLISNGSKITMEPSNLLKLSVKAKKRGETGKLEIKISWKEAKKVSVSAVDAIRVDT
jgi:amphi-Trp domain-containing protein